MRDTKDILIATSFVWSLRNRQTFQREEMRANVIKRGELLSRVTRYWQATSGWFRKKANYFLPPTYMAGATCSTHLCRQVSARTCSLILTGEFEARLLATRVLLWLAISNRNVQFCAELAPIARRVRPAQHAAQRVDGRRDPAKPSISASRQQRERR